MVEKNSPSNSINFVGIRLRMDGTRRVTFIRASMRVIGTISITAPLIAGSVNGEGAMPLLRLSDRKTFRICRCRPLRSTPICSVPSSRRQSRRLQFVRHERASEYGFDRSNYL